MLGKKLVKNLRYYLDPYFTVPVYTFDQNVTRELPCIVVGFKSETSSFSGNYGHYTVSGSIQVMNQGYEDSDNNISDSLAEQITNCLLNESGLLSAVNVPISGTDTRPASAFHLNALFIRSEDRVDEGTSTVIDISFDAFCAGKN